MLGHTKLMSTNRLRQSSVSPFSRLGIHFYYHAQFTSAIMWVSLCASTSSPSVM